MSQPLFINILSQQTQGALGGLPRSIVIASREVVAGSFTPNPTSGLYKINSTDLAAFRTANAAASPALVNALVTVFAGSIKPDYVYILSTDGSALASADLAKANIRPREWSFITLVSQTLGISDEATFLSDAATITTWISTVSGKEFVFTFSAATEFGTLPATLLLTGAINKNNLVKTIISDSFHVLDDFDPYENVYDNIALAWLAFCIYGGSVVRSMGSLSDAHDFPYVAGDAYTTTERSYIAAQNLAQYNDAKDLGGSAFVYDTQMNDENDPPTSKQIESQIAIDFINDYVYVGVRNKYQAAGQSNPLPADEVGVASFSSTVDALLKDTWNLGAILTSKGAPDYVLQTLTVEEMTQLSPNWQTTGIWPLAVKATIRPFAATHYVTMLFVY